MPLKEQVEALKAQQVVIEDISHQLCNTDADKAERLADVAEILAAKIAALSALAARGGEPVAKEGDEGTDASQRLLSRFNNKYGDLAVVMRAANKWQHALSEFRDSFNAHRQVPVTSKDVEDAEGAMLLCIRSYAIGTHPKAEVQPGWQPIETAPKDGKPLLLGLFNANGKWRTMRGEWVTQEYIDEYWEEPEEAEPGWHETAVESEILWPINPTHWQPLPAAPQGDNNG